MRKWILILLLIIPKIVLGQASYTVVTIPYKADNLNFFTGNGSTMFNVTLTGNVNTSGLNGGSLGMEVIFNICQDAVGGHTFNWPPNVISPPTINSAALACTGARFVNIGNFSWQNTGATPGASTVLPGGSPIQTQVNNNGTFGGTPCQSFGNIVAGPEFVDCDSHFKGPNPYIDATRFGVRPLFIPPSSTGNCTSGSSAITLTGGAGSPVPFINGDGVVLYGCGSGTITAPSAPTVTPSLAAAQTGALLDVNGLTGATTYCYQILATTFTGATNISPEVCTTTGAASLGPQSVTISAASLSNNIATYTTSSAHGLVAGAFVDIVNVDVPTASFLQFTNPFNCWCVVASAPDNTHFTVNVLADTRNGGLTTALANTGTVNWWNDVRIKAADLTGNYQYWVYGRVSGGTKTLLGPILPQNSTFAGDNTYQVFDDFGSTITTYPNPPPYVPTTVPTTATNSALISTIASGGGTTSLVLANQAGNTLSGVTVLYDDMVNFLTAANSAVNVAGGTVGALWLPDVGGNQSYHFNSPATLPAHLTVHQKGTVIWTAPVIVSTLTWVGELSSLDTSPSFTFTSTPFIRFGSGCSPCIYTLTGNNFFSNVAWGTNAVNGAIMFVQDGGGIPAAGSFDTVAFNLGTGSNPYMNMCCVFRAGAGYNFKKISLVSSQFNSAFSVTPGMYFDLANNVTIDDLNLSGVGILTRPNISGSFLNVQKVYSQANYMPFFSYVADGQSGGVSAARIGTSLADTTLVPLIASYGFGANVTPLTVTTDSVGFSTVPVFTGNAGGIFSSNHNPSPSVFPNLNTTSLNYRSSSGDGTLPGQMGSNFFNANMLLSPAYSFTTTTGINAAPSCVVSAGGSVPVGTLFYYYAPIYPNGGDGSYSSFCTTTTTTGNQTVTLTVPSPVAGVTQYNWFRGPTQRTSTRLNTVPVTGLTFVDTLAIGSGGGGDDQPGGGPAGIHGSLAWSQTHQTGLTSQTSSATVVRNVTWPDVGGDIYIVPTGTPTCAVTGGGTGATCGTFQTNSDDVSGAFTISTGTTPAVTGTITLTFSNSGGGIKYCVFVPANTGGANWNARASFIPTAAGGSNDQAAWDNNAVNLTGSTTYVVQYVCGRH